MLQLPQTSSFDTAEVNDRFRHVIFTAAPIERRKHRRASVQPAKVAARTDVARSEPPISNECAVFLDRVFRLASLPLPAYRLSPLDRRVPACLRALRCKSVESAIAIIESHPDYLHIAINALLVGVTSFFRDPEVFEFLRQTALPRLLARRVPLRVWSTACSDGAELYSIAMMLDQANALPGTDLLGTDFRATAVETAARGIYAAEAVQDLEPLLRNKYFRSHGTGYQICSTMKASTRWKVSDLLNEPPPGRLAWDMVLCRNLAIYLDAPASIRLWQILASALRPGGMLVVGKAERPVVRGLTRIGPCCYEKQ